MRPRIRDCRSLSSSSRSSSELRVSKEGHDPNANASESRRDEGLRATPRPGVEPQLSVGEYAMMPAGSAARARLLAALQPSPAPSRPGPPPPEPHLIPEDG